MKKIVQNILFSIGRLLGWRWLMFAAGVSLLAGVQSCKTVRKTCYEAVPVDTTSVNTNTIDTSNVVTPMCYDMAKPQVKANDEDSLTAPDDEFDVWEEMEDRDRDR